MSRPSYLVVAGASAGGVQALSTLVENFSADMDAAVLIVMHIAHTSISDFLLLKLQPHTTFNCKMAKDGMQIEKGCIYVSPANGHLLVSDGTIRIGHGPEENKWRPSIDILFRSAAASWSNRAIGVILTGLLDDGAVGMLAIQNSGGICIIQDPLEAEYPDMPLAAMELLDKPFSLPLTGIGEKLVSLIGAEPGEIVPAPQHIIAEARIAENSATGIDLVEALGQRSPYTCPDCGGGLWEIKDSEKVIHYRCHIGHAYNEAELEKSQRVMLEKTLWVALRAMEERRNLLRKMQRSSEYRGFSTAAETYGRRSAEMEMHIANLKELFFRNNPDDA